MKSSIATVSLGGTPTEWLLEIARAGFEGVSPFRDFGGMPGPQRSRGLERVQQIRADERVASRILV